MRPQHEEDSGGDDDPDCRPVHVHAHVIDLAVDPLGRVTSRL